MFDCTFKSKWEICVNNVFRNVYLDLFVTSEQGYFPEISQDLAQGWCT